MLVTSLLRRDRDWFLGFKNTSTKQWRHLLLTASTLQDCCIVPRLLGSAHALVPLPSASAAALQHLMLWFLYRKSSERQLGRNFKWLRRRCTNLRGVTTGPTAQPITWPCENDQGLSHILLSGKFQEEKASDRLWSSPSSPHNTHTHISVFPSFYKKKYQPKIKSFNMTNGLVNGNTGIESQFGPLSPAFLWSCLIFLPLRGSWSQQICLCSSSPQEFAAGCF